MERGERGRGGGTVPVVQLTRREKKAKIRRFTCRWYQIPEPRGGRKSRYYLSLKISLPRARNRNQGRLFPRRISEEEINASFFCPGGTFPTIDIEGKIFSQCYCHAVNLSPIFFATLLPGPRWGEKDSHQKGREGEGRQSCHLGPHRTFVSHLQALSFYTSTRGKAWPPSAARNIWLASALGHLAPPLSALDVSRHLVR